jgi:hypothetical protein
LIRVKVFRALDKWLNYSFKGLMLIHRGIWLGLLDRSALQHSTEEYYVTSATHHDPAYQLSGFLPWESQSLNRHFRDCRSFLVAGAGGGREVIALAKRDFRVDAFDCTESLIKTSNQLFKSLNIDGRIVLAPPDQVPPGFGVYDGIIVGWGSYMHICGQTTRIRFLRQLRQHSRPGSPLLLSFFTRDSASAYHYYRYNIARIVRRIRLSTEPVELGDDLDPTFVHRFTQAEIADEMKMGGYELVYFREQPYGHAVGRAI